MRKRQHRQSERLTRRARVLLHEWCAGQDVYGIDAVAHAEHVARETQLHWHDLPVEKYVGILLHEAPSCSGPISHIHDILIRDFGVETANMVWGLDRALSLTRHPHDLPRLHAHLRTLVQQDVWTLRALAAHIAVERPRVMFLAVVRDTLLSACVEQLPLTLQRTLTAPV